MGRGALWSCRSGALVMHSLVGQEGDDGNTEFAVRSSRRLSHLQRSRTCQLACRGCFTQVTRFRIVHAAAPAPVALPCPPAEPLLLVSPRI
jgi:hypothetical protein